MNLVEIVRLDMNLKERQILVRWGTHQSIVEIDVDELNTPAHDRDIVPYGKSLYDKTLRGSVFEAARRQAANTGSLVQLFIATTPAVHADWELLHDSEGFLQEADVVVIRLPKVGGSMPARPLAIGGHQLNVLATVFPTIDRKTDEYAQVLEDMFKQLRYSSPHIRMTLLRRPSRQQFVEALLEAQENHRPFHAWHYFGASDPGGGVVFNSGVFKAEHLAAITREYTDLKMVIFDLASWQPFQQSEAFAQHVPLFICPLKSDDRSLMTQFAKELYQQLDQAKRVPQALHAARKHLIHYAFAAESAWCQIAVYSTTSDEYFLMPIPDPPHNPVPRDQVCISYSHGDAHWLGRLMEYLDPLRRGGVIKTWADTDIEAGSDWMAAIQDALDRAKVAVLIASPKFFRSEFITTVELPYLLKSREQGNCTVIWVAASAYVYELTPLATIQAAHPPNEPLDRLSDHQAQDVLIHIARLVNTALNK